MREEAPQRGLLARVCVARPGQASPGQLDPHSRITNEVAVSALVCVSATAKANAAARLRNAADAILRRNRRRLDDHREDHLALRLARQDDPEPFHIEETATSFAIDWKGLYRIEGGTTDRDTGRIKARLSHDKFM